MVLYVCKGALATMVSNERKPAALVAMSLTVGLRLSIPRDAMYYILHFDCIQKIQK